MLPLIQRLDGTRLAGRKDGYWLQHHLPYEDKVMQTTLPDVSHRQEVYYKSSSAWKHLIFLPFTKQLETVLFIASARSFSIGQDSCQVYIDG